jgi:hypothetical protein
MYSALITMKLRQERYEQEHVAPNGACLLVQREVYQHNAPKALEFETALLPRFLKA